MSVSVFNRCWARVILETLVRQGVTAFCIAPGSRSTPLTLEAARLQQNNRVNCHTHFTQSDCAFCTQVGAINTAVTHRLQELLPPIYTLRDY